MFFRSCTTLIILFSRISSDPSEDHWFYYKICMYCFHTYCWCSFNQPFSGDDILKLLDRFYDLEMVVSVLTVNVAIFVIGLVHKNLQELDHNKLDFEYKRVFSLNRMWELYLFESYKLMVYLCFICCGC